MVRFNRGLRSRVFRWERTTGPNAWSHGQKIERDVMRQRGDEERENPTEGLGRLLFGRAQGLSGCIRVPRSGKSSARLSCTWTARRRPFAQFSRIRREIDAGSRLALILRYCLHKMLRYAGLCVTIVASWAGELRSDVVGAGLAADASLVI